MGQCEKPDTVNACNSEFATQVPTRASGRWRQKFCEIVAVLLVDRFIACALVVLVWASLVGLGIILVRAAAGDSLETAYKLP